jgi:hypothetical protein
VVAARTAATAFAFYCSATSAGAFDPGGLAGAAAARSIDATATAPTTTRALISSSLVASRNPARETPLE